MIENCFYHENNVDALSNRLHTHENECEIIQTLSEGGCFIINSKAYPITKNSLFIINALDIHCSNPENSSKYIRNKLIINKRLFYDMVSSFRIKQLNDMLLDLFNTKHLIISEHSAKIIDELFADIFNGYKSNTERNAFNTYAKVFSLFQKCVDSLISPEAHSAYQYYINTILEYIDERLNEDLTLDGISSIFHINKSYLCRIFKKSTNSTLMEYIKLQRLVNAKKLLRSSEKYVTDIAMQCGFSSSSYFSNAFKIAEGLSPSEYRANYKNTK